jgi:anaerobic selenocysteine-containing dehydrogenase
MLDRLEGPSPPKLVVVDPRRTAVAARADVHLPIRPGTNVALLNAILHEMIANGWVDHEWVRAHTAGYDGLAGVVAEYPPQAVEEICGVPADSIRAAARILGTGERVVSTVLQGVYQSHQATAAAVQVNNINLLRGMIGRPGCAVFQMNGQPTAENTRETGADGSLPGYRNWQNDEHVREIAEAWNVGIWQVPHWAPPTHAMEIFRQCENGTIRFLWVTATNPLVSLPELHRIRSILEQERLFLVVSDAFLSETAQVADVVLPPRCGRKRRAVSPTPTGPCTCRSKRLTRPARPAATWTSSSTTPGVWACGTRTAHRWSNGPPPSRRGTPSPQSHAAGPATRAH